MKFLIGSLIIVIILTYCAADFLYHCLKVKEV